MDTGLIWNLVAILLVVIGLLGTLLPVLPGLPVLWAGLLLAAWNDGFARVGAGTITALTVLLLVAIAVDVLAGYYGARRAGASAKAQWGAAIGALAGLFFGLPGLLLGPWLGAVGGEVVHGTDWRAATKIGFGTWLGLAVGVVLKLAIAVAMLAVFAFAMWVL
ncbi:DUF456 domain-containing protein [Arenimonas composti]|uniref:DUF456 domain-containing protein n=1 Tax=Arenimonas composti TR7-09 = DSM 18010 TaxID=1121013 RepID=A0A091B6N9_9GAMM|nr:DUF456 domain-containing protein [Arenimonas composti]KFN47391.1 hypothetical protein P873_01750 [Arenimonas composti TR7-09 = DSM 18010]